MMCRERDPAQLVERKDIRASDVPDPLQGPASRDLDDRIHDVRGRDRLQVSGGQANGGVVGSLGQQPAHEFEELRDAHDGVRGRSLAQQRSSDEARLTLNRIEPIVTRNYWPAIRGHSGGADGAAQTSLRYDGLDHANPLEAHVAGEQVTPLSPAAA